MKLNALVPILWTNQFTETIEFYITSLGFICNEQNDGWGWASLHRDAVEIMIAKPNAHTNFAKPFFTGSFYISTDNVDELWQQLHEKVTIVYPVETFEWGMKEFAIYDNNGYIIQFGQQVSDQL